jgi:hypothetical protein
LVGAKMIGRIAAAYTEIERMTRRRTDRPVDDADVIEYRGASSYYLEKLACSEMTVGNRYLDTKVSSACTLIWPGNISIGFIAAGPGRTISSSSTHPGPPIC